MKLYKFHTDSYKECNRANKKKIQTEFPQETQIKKLTTKFCGRKLRRLGNGSHSSYRPSTYSVIRKR